MNANGRSDGKSTLVQVMAWCRQATSHYLSQCWPRSLSPYGVIRPQWVNTTTHNKTVCIFYEIYCIFLRQNEKNDFFFYLPGQKSKRPKPHRTYSSTETKMYTLKAPLIRCSHCYNSALLQCHTCNCYNPTLTLLQPHTCASHNPYIHYYHPILKLLQTHTYIVTTNIYSVAINTCSVTISNLILAVSQPHMYIVTNPYLHCYHSIFKMLQPHTYIVTAHTCSVTIPYLHCYNPMLTLLQPHRTLYNCYNPIF